MSYRNFKIDSFCVGGKKRFAATKIYGEITSKGSKVIIGYCYYCKRRKSTAVSDNTKQMEGVSRFFKKFGKISAEAGKELATNVLKEPGKFLEKGANVATAAASRIPKAALSTLTEVI